MELDENGLAKRIANETQHPLPITLLVRSRQGRGHLYFRQNAASIAMGNITQPQVKGARFSIRVNNEYVVCPGAFRQDLNRFYEPVQVADIVEAPQWLIDWILEQRIQKDKMAELQRDENNKIPYGQIHDCLVQEAGRLAARGYSLEARENALVDWSIDNCAVHDEDHVREVAQSTKNWKMGDPRPEILFGGNVTQKADPLAGVQQVIEEQPKEWGTPEEINDGLLPVLPFDISFVPNCMQAFVVDTAALMSVPLDFTGITLLGVLAGCVNRRAFVFPKKHYKKWREALAASGGLVTPSGGLKTPTFKIFTNILVEKQVDWQTAHREKMKKYEQACKLVKEENKKRKESESPLLDMPEKPAPCRRLISNDSTPEKLHIMLAENPVGLCVHRDELSCWIAELDKPGREGQRSLFLAAMNGDDAHSVERISREDVFAIMSLSIFGGIQPPLLVNFINDERNIWDGTLARLGLLVYPDEVFIPTADREANEAAYLTARKVLRTLAEMDTKQILLHFDDAAQPVFDQWFEELRVKIDNEKHPGKKSHISKYRGLLPKLAGLVQLADLVGSLPAAILSMDDGDTAAAITGAQYIRVEYLQRAIRLLSYLESHMHRIYGLNRTANTRAVFALAKKVRDGEIRSGFSIRDITRNDWNDLTEADHVKFAVEALEDKGWLREKIAETGKRGRPTQRWEINPAIGKE